MKYNFDEIVNRKGSNCTKWDGNEKYNKPKDIIPLWVADMDFKAPQPIIDALNKRVSHGVYGYELPNEKYYESVCNWMERRHDWSIETKMIVPIPGVVTALKIAINEFSEVGDAIIIQKPVYHPFDASIEQNDRIKIENSVVFNGTTYDIDFEDFEEKIVKHKVKMFIMCNPYNPIGKVWTREELQKIGDICKKHQVIVISDEIHHDFVYGDHKHIPFTEVDPTFKDFTVICTAPSKSFNLAGLQVSNIIIEDDYLRDRFQKCSIRLGFHEPTVFGLTACMAAYNECEDWFDQMLEYVKGNFDFVDNFLKTKLPQIKLIEPQGLYLAWIDFRALGMDNQALEKFMIEKAGLWVNDGYIFGQDGSGFERFNLATSRLILEKALTNLEEAIKTAGLL